MNTEKKDHPLNSLNKKINYLIDSVESLLENLPSLEVNTMVVDYIVPSYFIPEKIYQDIYLISQKNLEKKGTDRSLWPSYLELRNNLELEYLIFNKNASELPDSDYEIKLALTNTRFLQNLRKIAEIKSILDNRNQQLINQKKDEQNIETGIIFAQTKIDLDGVITNHYSEEILTHPNQKIILEIHRDSVNSGYRQWLDFLQSVIQLLQKTC